MQLEAIKAERGETKEQELPDKPLAQVLADAKQAKEDAFQAQWKQMKTGAGTTDSAGRRRLVLWPELSCQHLRLLHMPAASHRLPRTGGTPAEYRDTGAEEHMRNTAAALGSSWLRLWTPCASFS
jgi:hypothetical protein